MLARLAPSRKTTSEGTDKELKYLEPQIRDPEHF